jgi:hypothetical protein
LAQLLATIVRRAAATQQSDANRENKAEFSDFRDFQSNDSAMSGSIARTLSLRYKAARRVNLG